MRLYNSVAVFLLGTFALIIPSGYSLGSAMLLIGSLVLLVKRPAMNLSHQDWLIICAVLAYTLVSMLEALWDQQGVSGFDKPIRFLLALPALLMVMAYPPRLSWLWVGLAFGAIGAGGWASWQKLVENAWRATGYTQVIQFGNLSMLMGILCLAGLGWAWLQPRRKSWLTLMLIGAFMGFLGSLFSGSRGGWIGIPFVLLVLYRGYGYSFSKLAKGVVGIGIIVAAATIYAVPQFGVQQRVHQAFDDIANYASGENRSNSVGARFEMWRGASQLILEKPFTGWGSNGYQEGIETLAYNGKINPNVVHYKHPHNEFLDAWAKRGLIGLVVLLALYLIPMRFFSRQLNSPDLELRSLAVAGVLLPVAYIDFGFSQAFLTHNSGVMMFVFWLAVLWGCFSVRTKLN
ncbi:O-antigen ligase [Halomonas sp. M1]|uniref:O-antigen ligase family protein n=1 Tax=Halomonas sp. M1 TaxID=3035470 RepID=UPI002486C194|nr:O-antigen ligase [Halomonas sp. M1]WFE72457.1 O-antigen ligase [Halomonas sp. M1]